jgi:pre-mRNA-splicing factor 38A
MYVRMTFPSLEVYEVLEPMLNDYRKLRWRDMSESHARRDQHQRRARTP